MKPVHWRVTMTGRPDPDEAFDAEELATLREAAEEKRAAGDAALADVLDYYAENGLPVAQECTPWEELRDAHYRSLGVKVSGSHVA
jgi:hypothetical protein